MKKIFTLLSVCFCLSANAQVCFNAVSNLAAPFTNPVSVKSADFNGDGILDLVIANYNTNNVSVLLGLGTGSFGSPTNFAVGAPPLSVICADFNRDGIIDLATANSTNISILLGTGTGSFGTASNFSGAQPTSIISADFNGDGKVDLAVSNDTYNYLSVFLGTGTGSFSTAVNFAVGTGAREVTSADFNGDGKVDLAVANSGSNNVSVLLGTGSGTFGTAINFATDSQPYSVTSADFNGDGKTDLAVANYGSSSVSILLGTGTGSFGAATSTVAGINPNSVTSADFNGDGKIDLAVTNYQSSVNNDVAILLGTGTGSFGVATNFTTSYWSCSVISGDFNGDGKVDLALANTGSTTIPISVLLNCTAFCTGSFGTAVSFVTGTSPRSVTNADFNGDGIADLAVANQSTNNVSVFLGTGNGSFGVTANFSTGTTPYSVISADFNRDGKVDLAVANSGSNDVSILLGTGTGNFGTATNFAAGTSPYSVTSSDFNGDGKIDLAVTNYNSNTVSILLGTGGGSFGGATIFAAGTNPYSVISADFNRDGKTDLAVTNWGSNNLSILLGTGNGSFGVASNFVAGTNPCSITCADFNRDGKIDLAIANAYSANVSVLLGTGTGSFAATVNYAAGANPVSVTIADFNGDGKADIAAANWGSSNVSLLFGTGSGSFGSAASFAADNNSASIISADFNRDGKPDLAVANNGSNNVSILLINTPDGPTGIASQSFCSGASPTAADLTATGSAIQWYIAASGGTALTANTALINNTHYFASQTINSCGGESAARFDVTVTINTTPAAPAGNAAPSYCSGANPAVADLIVTGGNPIKWYDAASTGTLHSGSDALVNAAHYYASQTVNGCESSLRLDVTATVNTTPLAPTGNALQSFCSAANPTIADLISSGGSPIQWYDAASAGTLHSGTDPLVNAAHYYASQTISGCESSLRLNVTATVNTTPTAPTGITSQTFCSGANPVVGSLTATGGGTIKWYDAVSGGALHLNTDTLVNAAHYYASQTVSGCESSLRFDVTATIDTTPTITASAVVSILCAGDSTKLNGGGALSYVWTGGISDGVSFAPASTATYTVTGTAANACTSTAVKTITVHLLPVVTASATSATLCAGGSTILTGGGAVSYVWTGGISNGVSFTPAATLTYTVTGTDANSCSKTASKIITVNTLPIVTANATADALCAGASTILSGGGAVSYLWTGGVSNGVSFIHTSTATYTVTGTDVHSCTNTASKTITVTPLPDATTTLSGLTITANETGAIFQWLNCSNANAPIASQTNQAYTASVNGSYAVKVTKNGCTDTSACTTINNVGIIENNAASGIIIYPNPFTSQTTISFTQEQKNTSVKIMDMLGKEVKTILFTGTELIIEKGDMQAGIYFVQIIDESFDKLRMTNVVNRKIVLQ